MARTKSRGRSYGGQCPQLFRTTRSAVGRWLNSCRAPSHGHHAVMPSMYHQRGYHHRAQSGQVAARHNGRARPCAGMLRFIDPPPVHPLDEVITDRARIRTRGSEGVWQSGRGRALRFDIRRTGAPTSVGAVASTYGSPPVEAVQPPIDQAIYALGCGQRHTECHCCPGRDPERSHGVQPESVKNPECVAHIQVVHRLAELTGPLRPKLGVVHQNAPILGGQLIEDAVIGQPRRCVYRATARTPAA